MANKLEAIICMQNAARSTTYTSFRVQHLHKLCRSNVITGCLIVHCMRVAACSEQHRWAPTFRRCAPYDPCLCGTECPWSRLPAWTCSTAHARAPTQSARAWCHTGRWSGESRWTGAGAEAGDAPLCCAQPPPLLQAAQAGRGASAALSAPGSAQRRAQQLTPAVGRRAAPLAAGHRRWLASSGRHQGEPAAVKGRTAEPHAIPHGACAGPCLGG